MQLALFISEDQKKREKPPPAPKSREVSKRVSDVKVSKVKNPVLFSDDEDDARGMVWNISFFYLKYRYNMAHII